MLLQSVIIYGLLAISGHILFVGGTDLLECQNHAYCETLFVVSADAEVVFCVENKCQCADFYVMEHSPAPTPIYKCWKSVPLGKTCTDRRQCIISEGDGEVEATRCSPGNPERKCECHNGSGDDTSVEEFEGRCYRVKKLTYTCVNDRGCILGSNEFARCTNSTCQCHKSELAEFVADEHGMCVIDKEENSIDLSILAITVSCSAVLFVILLVLYILTKPKHDTHRAQPRT